ncbi:hypothetical protein ACH3Y9_05310 [Streptomyces sp. WSLK1-5]|uniref:hypothetical protein n=1 Tax=unclassified Streptomyces TaxID=2593676 RepID=UPI000F64CE32|nr:hypothetical protein [Streptomyces sp. RP5T]RRR77388.1 hypothetical protein EHS43_28470 [Streptomyces sp. RP5T]
MSESTAPPIGHEDLRRRADRLLDGGGGAYCGIGNDNKPFVLPAITVRDTDGTRPDVMAVGV